MGSSALKKFLTNPDRESVAELRDPEALRKYDEQHGSGTVVHASGIPFQVTERGGKWYAKGKVHGQLHRFTADTRDALYPKITGAVNQSAVKELSRTQELEVIRLCQSGHASEGIARYLEYRVGEERGSRYDSPAELTSDPALLDVMNECASFTWFHSRPDVQDSPEFQSFANAYLAERPVTHQLLSAAWQAFEKVEYTSILPRALRETQEPASPHEIHAALEDASDAEVENMMTATKKEFARQVRAGVR